jgi:hypothetical protein
VISTRLIWLRIGTSEHGNEPAGSMKCWEVLSRVAAQLAGSQEGLSYMKSVSLLVSMYKVTLTLELSLECSSMY